MIRWQAYSVNNFCSSNEGVFFHCYVMQFNTLNSTSTAVMVVYREVFKLVQR